MFLTGLNYGGGGECEQAGLKHPGTQIPKVVKMPSLRIWVLGSMGNLNPLESEPRIRTM
jgi:hypothetical protein